MTPFTVLQSVYKSDSPAFLDESLQSIADNTLQPDRVVLVKDGVLTPELECVIESWRGKLPLEVVGYEENRGLGYALNYGLQFVRTELVARMDSDDVCMPARFEKQAAFMELHPEIALLSGYIDEFIDDENTVVSRRYVPIQHAEIERYLKKRNAFNHMAMMFRKAAVQAAGGYQEVPYFEDYDLWIRVIQAGYAAENHCEVLVKVRIGKDMIGRRHGISYCRKELFFLKRQYRSHFLSAWEYLSLVLVRVPVRLLPKNILGFIYRYLRSTP